MNQYFVDTYQKMLTDIFPSARFVCGDIRDIVKTELYDTILSPANSYGDMRGGIDAIYIELFPKLKKLVRNIAAERNGINIGDLEICDIPENPGIKLIIMPTMVCPGNIRGSDNVFKAFIGLLTKLHYREMTVLCPCLGTGVGMMTAEESAIQIKYAYQYYKSCEKI